MPKAGFHPPFAPRYPPFVGSGIMSPMEPRRLAILGVGLLGGSLGLACKSAATGIRICGYAHNPQTRRLAMDRGVVDEMYADPAQAVHRADWVVLCTPVGLFESLLRQIAPHLAPGTIVTDVGSTKASVVAAAAGLPQGVHFVGSHPMAGSEKRGVEFARPDLYRNALCIVTPTASTDPEALAAVERFWQRLEMRTTRLSPQAHDHLIAQVSHVPHVAAAALVAVASEPALPLAGKGFLDTTRIAAGDSALWRDILLDNAPNVCDTLVQLREQLQELETHLARGDSEAVRHWLERAAQKRSAMVS